MNTDKKLEAKPGRKKACQTWAAVYIISVMTEITVITQNERTFMKPLIATFEPGTVTVLTYLVYLGISVAMTIWVARTLHKNGRIFLVENFNGKEPLADSVNHLLVVGFYLINIGFVTLALKYGDKATDAQTALEILSSKVGLVLVVLGVMHFFNLYVFAKLRRRATQHRQLPPVLPHTH